MRGFGHRGLGGGGDDAAPEGFGENEQISRSRSAVRNNGRWANYAGDR